MATRLLHSVFTRSLAVAGWMLVSAAVGAADGPSVVAPSEQPPAPEVLQYRWRLEGFGGRLAAIFLPGKGNGTLTTGLEPDGKVHSELLITSPDSDEGEFWRYGAEIDAASHATLRAWSSYRFRGKSKSKDLPVASPGLVDISAAIYMLRQAPPRAAMPLQIWSEGHLYPVRVVPGILERIHRTTGEEVLVRRYSIEGVEEVGARFWKGRLELALAEGGTHAPIEIVIRVSLASLRLRLVDTVLAGDDADPADAG